MIILTTLEIDVIVPEALIIQTNEDDSNYGEASRRQNRVATLDGGSVLQDRSYSDTDLTFKITAEKYIEAQFNALQYLLEKIQEVPEGSGNFTPEVRISTRIGSFIGTISKLSVKDASFDFLVTQDD